MRLVTTIILVSASGFALAQTPSEDSNRIVAIDEEPIAVAGPLEASSIAPPIGWLSDPSKEPEHVLEALLSGKIHFNNRFRIEFADTTSRNSSTAVTNRLRLGYETKSFYGFSGYIEMENVLTPATDNYFVPATGNGTSSRTVVADPIGTEINQFYGRFNTEFLLDTRLSLDVKGGRQRIKLDDSRFIGNVGWRQFEQTYDSVSVRTNLGLENLSVFYAYLWGVQRIFGPEGPNFDSDSHLINVSYKLAPEIKITSFAYLLDFEDDSPINSSNTYGVRLTGELWKNADDPADLFADYELTYAHQQDAGSNPINYDADFFAAQLRVTQKQVGFFKLGYQFLGSDDGNLAFRFPLGTNHAFQGHADNFLVTPNAGLQDLYFGGGVELPWGIKGAVTYHLFWSDEGGDDLGHEIDFSFKKKINPNWSALVGGGFYDGSSGQPDTTRVWLQTTVSF